jgi:hypothetical protein
VLVELAKTDVDVPRLTQAQATADQLPHALAGYVSWLAPQLDELRVRLPETFRTERSRGAGGAAHRRLPANIAHLSLGFDTCVRFAEAVGAVTADEAARRRTQAAEAFTALVERQERALAAEASVLRFLRGLNAVLVGGRSVLVDVLAATEQAQAPTVLGWDDEEFLYLSPEAVYGAVVRHYRDAGEAFPIRQGRLLEDLKHAGLSTCDPGRNTTTATIGGRKRRVLKLDRVVVRAHLGDDLPPPWKPPAKDERAPF